MKKPEENVNENVQENAQGNTQKHPEWSAQNNTLKLVKMGMLVALSILLVYLIHFPIFPAVPYLEYDPADIPILIGTFAFGPVAGLILTVVTAIVQGLTVSAASGVYGILMHIIATGAYVIVAGLIYSIRVKTKKKAVIALICGVAAMTLVMIPSNLIVTPAFTGMPRSAIVGLLPFIIAFNALKAGINAVVTFLLYKRISGFLKR